MKRFADLTEQEVLRNRLLVAEQGLVGIPRQSRREEEARELARAHTRDLEFAWATFLICGMEQGRVPQADARLLTRALLGLYPLEAGQVLLNDRLLEDIPVAERVGLVRMLDYRVLELVVNELADAPALKASVNVSPASAVDPDWDQGSVLVKHNQKYP